MADISYSLDPVSFEQEIGDELEGCSPEELRIIMENNARGEGIWDSVRYFLTLRVVKYRAAERALRNINL